MSKNKAPLSKNKDNKNGKFDFIRSLVDGPGSISSIAPSITSNKLWTIATNKQHSKRFSQLSFEGFRPKGKNRFERFINLFGEFFIFLGKYTRRKSVWGIRLGKEALVFGLNKTLGVKAWVIKKLIWSRGKLGRPIATTIVVSSAFIVFMFGEVFNSSKFVNSQEINPDYLSNVSDIIPRKNVALTTIPESRKQSEPFSYTVESGDTLSSIGNRFKISTDALKYVNGMSDASILKVGQELTIPPVSGLVHTVKSGDSLASIATKYDVAPQAVADFNYILDTTSLSVGTELVIPGASVPQPVIIPNSPLYISPNTPLIDPSASTGWCMWPTSTRIITQYFSWYHNGLDIAASGWLPPIYACGEGVVIRSGWDPFGLGLHVRIDHGGGYETVYGHMSRLDVSYGQRVGKGQQIGVMGSTGRSTGPHVHFMVKYNGVAQNPMNYAN